MKKRKKAPARKKAVRRPAPKPALPTSHFDPKVFARRRACVLGLGRSGLAAAKLLSKKGWRVFVSDSRPRKELKDLAAKLPANAKWEGGGHSEKVLECDFAVKSPGIHPHAPVLEKLRASAKPVFSELEVAMAFCPSKEIVAVTGTNGKTTTTELTAAIFRAAGRRVHVAGNVGDAVSGEIAKVRKKDVVVLETSSYQLEDSRYFKPASSVILNITSDHLDHHGSMAAYLAAKARIFKHQDRSTTAIFNAADALTFSLARACRARKLFFSMAPSTRSAAWFEGGKIHVRLPGQKKALLLPAPRIPGEHNLENAMAASLLALSRGVKPPAIARALKSFKGVEHRIEGCGAVRGLECVNDSKATNVDSTLAALKTMPEPPRGAAGEDGRKILLILGGLAKPGGFSALRSPVERKVKAILTIGSAAAKIESDLAGAAHIFPCETLEQAVRGVVQIGQKGETWLLSPACASFDQFKNFEDRGRRFKALVAAARSGKLN